LFIVCLFISCCVCVCVFFFFVFIKACCVNVSIVSLSAVSSGSDDPPPPPKPSRFPGVISGNEMSTSSIPQTYIVAQNPEVLVHLLRENESRGVNPSVYNTPASAFNTLAVDFHKISSNSSDPKSDPPSFDNNLEPSVSSKLTANKSLPRNFGGGSLSKFSQAGVKFLDASLVSVLSGSSRDVTRRRSSTPSLKEGDAVPDKVCVPVPLLSMSCMLCCIRLCGIKVSQTCLNQ
jgi:hypothetical protein